MRGHRIGRETTGSVYSLSPGRRSPVTSFPPGNTSFPPGNTSFPPPSHRSPLATRHSRPHHIVPPSQHVIPAPITSFPPRNTSSPPPSHHSRLATRHSHPHHIIPTSQHVIPAPITSFPPRNTSFPRRRESPVLRPTTYSWEHSKPHKVTGCIRRMVRGGRIQIPAFAGMTNRTTRMT